MCSWCNYSFNLLHLPLPKQFPLFILASSVCWSLQYLISALTQGSGGGHFFRLTCLVLLWGEGNTANKYHWHVWECSKCFSCTGFAPAHDVCAFMVYTCQALGCSTGNCLRWALHCMHFPGLGHSGSDSWVLHKGADGKVSVYTAGDLGSIPGSGRFPGEGNANPLHYSCPENPMDRVAWVAKSWTQLSDFTFTFTSREAQTQLGLHFVPFPGPRSSGDQVLGDCSHPQLDGASYCLLQSQTLSFLGVQWAHLLMCAACPSGELISGCDPPGGCQPSRIPRRLG